MSNSTDPPIPPHVAAANARRAREMNRVDPAKLAEWEGALELTIVMVDGLTVDSLAEVPGMIRRRLESLRADIARAREAEEEKGR